MTLDMQIQSMAYSLAFPLCVLNHKKNMLNMNRRSIIRLFLLFGFFFVLVIFWPEMVLG